MTSIAAHMPILKNRPKQHSRTWNNWNFKKRSAAPEGSEARRKRCLKI
jgi:hypothetical protein